jgi:pimeloyl-ACP methyl ester carboxylesterase
MPSSGFLAVAGQRLEYLRITGTRAGPALILLHEGLGCVAMWKEFPHALARLTGLEVWAYSRAGYGASSAIALPRPIDFHTAEALEVLPAFVAAAGIGEYVLVGHSDGASIALIHAGAGTPQSLRALAVLAPHVFTETKCTDSIRVAVEAYEHGGLRERLIRYHGTNVDTAFFGWSGVWLDPRFAAWDLRAYLHGICVPILALRGSVDPYNSSKHLQIIAQSARGHVAVRELDGVGHAPHVEESATVLEQIAAQLEHL